MSEQEALANIKKLKNMIIHTKSRKMKRIYMLDIIHIQEFLASYYDLHLNEKDLYVSTLYEECSNKIQELDYYAIKEAIEVNSYTKKLSKGVLNLFSKFNYKQQLDDRIKISTDELNDMMIDFVSQIGTNAVDKYDEIENDGVLINDLVEYGGICWNIYGLKKQIINVSSFFYDYDDSRSDIEFFKALVHEFGHAMHLSKVGEIAKKRRFISIFDESMSMLYEIMFIDYLEKNNINVRPTLLESYNSLLENSVVAKAGSFALEKDDLTKGWAIPDKYFSNGYFDKYYDVSKYYTNTDITGALPYFYGELIASKIFEDNNYNYKNSNDQLLDILIKSESDNPVKILEEIGLNKVPKTVVKTLNKIK